MTATNNATAGLVDSAGVRHLVSFHREYLNYWTGGGRMSAECLCGWGDDWSYERGGEPYARMKLAWRAMDHLPDDLRKARA